MTTSAELKFYRTFAILLGIYLAARIAWFLWRHCGPARRVDRLREHLGPGSWAVITGGSAGIGRALALELAHRGINVVLLARDADRLEAVAAECTASGACAKVITVDFAAPDWAEIAHELAAVGDVSMLVNCCGFSSAGNRQARYSAVRCRCSCYYCCAASLATRCASSLRDLGAETR